MWWLVRWQRLLQWCTVYLVVHYGMVILSFCFVTQNIENNWRCGHHRLDKILCHSESSKGVYCLQYDEEKIVSGLRDNTIKVRKVWKMMLVIYGVHCAVQELLQLGHLFFIFQFFEMSCNCSMRSRGDCPLQQWGNARHISLVWLM